MREMKYINIFVKIIATPNDFMLAKLDCNGLNMLGRKQKIHT
jgi:hypothetical protein